MEKQTFFIPTILKKLLFKFTLSTNNEICGVLIGYKEDKAKYYLTNIIKDDNPLYSSIYKIIRNTESLYPLINDLVKSTDKCVDFIGDWHSHPKGSCQYSVKDYKSMIKMLNDTDYYFLDELILLITNQFQKMKAFLFTHLNDKPLTMKIKIT